MAQRKFNIFTRGEGNTLVEKVLSKTKKYRMKRDGSVVEYDDTVVEQQKQTVLNTLEQQKLQGQITDEEYAAQVKEAELTYSTLNQLTTEVADDELVFSGSKSDIRKGEMLERNMSILYATKADVTNLRYDIAFFSPNEQPMNETLMSFAVPVDLIIEENLSQAHGSTIAFEGFVAAPYTIQVYKNDVQVGTITIEVNGSTTVSVPALTLTKGDKLRYIAPDQFEADMKDLAITVAANQVNK